MYCNDRKTDQSTKWKKNSSKIKSFVKYLTINIDTKRIYGNGVNHAKIDIWLKFEV